MAVTPEQINLIITEVFDLLRVIVGAAIGAITTWLVTSQTLKRTERRKVQRDLGKLQFAIISENVANNYLLRLKALKDFFTEHYDMLGKHKVNQEFFLEWLQHPFIGESVVDPSWTSERITKLKNDVQKLKV